MTFPRFGGLVAAGFSPFADDGSLDLEPVHSLVEQLVRDGVDGVFLAGTTGEGESLSFRERRDLAERYVDASAGNLPVIVHVGRQSLVEGRELAAHAASIGADAIAGTAPAFFKPRDCATLAAAMAEIAAGAPELPFYYYHIPRLTGAPDNMPAFISEARERIPNFHGIKFSEPDVMGFQRCVAERDLDILWGVDEMLLTGLTHGAAGAIGSTYNFAAPLYRKILAAHAEGDLSSAQAHQRQAVHMVDVLLRHGALPAFKETMKLIGIPVGSPRLPVASLTETTAASLERELREIGFFDWGRTP